ncbi:unnamed protein product [Rhizophagus irregularis]|nr:unnamed protein product [Rhizophagus irregularis]
MDEESRHESPNNVGNRYYSMNMILYLYRVTREASIVRRRSFICDHSRTYNSSSIKDTSTKKLNCPFFVNASYPKNKNPQGFVFINKLNESHNHPLNRSMIKFEDAKRFTPEMIDDIRFTKS